MGEGLIPLMSEIFQAMAFLCSFNTWINSSFSLGCKLEAIITGNVELFPRNAYSKWFGNCLSSSLEGSLIEGFCLSSSFTLIPLYSTRLEEG